MRLLDIISLIFLVFTGAAVFLAVGAYLIRQICCRKRRGKRQFYVGGQDDKLQNFTSDTVTEAATNGDNVVVQFESENRSRRPVVNSSSYSQLQLTSRPSAPSVHDLNEHHANNVIQRTTSLPFVHLSNTRAPLSIYNSVEVEDDRRIREIQKDLLQNGIRLNGADVEHNLLIGVDAQPNVFAGYCVHLQDKTLRFYSISTEDLPWRFPDTFDNSEFEMKNFLFALMLWGDEIRSAKKLLIFTGNRGISYDNNKYGRRASKLLDHYQGCEGIFVGNYLKHVNKKNDPKSFAVNIQPAQDLSSGNFYEFVDFVFKYYGIARENCDGTHRIKQADKGSVKPCKQTDNYWIYIKKVRDTMREWTEPCHKCGYVDDETVSVLSLNQIS